MKHTKILWINQIGKHREHSMGFRCTLAYARNWWRENIMECQGILSIDARRSNKLQLIQILETLPMTEA